VTGSVFIKCLICSPASDFLIKSCLYDICDAHRINIPIRKYHIPPMKPPMIKVIIPMIIKNSPMLDPNPEAIRVAQRRFPLIFQRAARNILPPSNGNAGNRLKPARIKLSHIKYFITPVTGPCRPAFPPTNTAAAIKDPRTALETGPITAMRNSTLGALRLLAHFRNTAEYK